MWEHVPETRPIHAARTHTVKNTGSINSRASLSLGEFHPLKLRNARVKPIVVQIITSMLVKSYHSSSVLTRGVSREAFRDYYRRLVTTCYGVLHIAEKERA